MPDFTGKVALVTGGASGIGRATALGFARAGASLVIGDTNPAGATLAAEIHAAGGHARFLQTDVTDAAACEALVQAALSQFGRLDAAANIAGVVHEGGMFCAPAERERALAVNLHGVIHSVLAQATVMKPAGAGAIVNVSSIAGIQGSSVSTYYSTAKHAVIGFTKSVALELAPHGIRVNAICPGFTATPMTESRFGDALAQAGAQFTPLGRIGQPQDQANAIIWLCSEEAAFISGAGGKITEWKFDWEKPYLEMTKDFIMSNTFAQMERAMLELGEEGTRYEFECYDTAHLYNLAHFVDRGIVKPPFFIQGVFGILGGIGADPENVMFLKSTADRLFGEDYIFSALAAGRHQMRLVTLSALLGGCVRVGLEDSLYAGKGEMATSNAVQVAKIRRILEELSLVVATPTEAREMMQTKGGDKVNF